MKYGTYPTDNISALIGQTLSEAKQDGDDLVFITSQGDEYRLTHIQDCCESVELEDVVGDLSDLEGVPKLGESMSSKIDRLIAEHVMGWTEYRIGRVGSEYWYPAGTTPRTPPFQAGAIPVELFTPSSDIEKAWQVAIVLMERGLRVEVSATVGGTTVTLMVQEGPPGMPRVVATADAPETPLAVCLAAFKVSGVEWPAQSVGTTSDKQQTPAGPDDSAPSARTESEDPGSC